MGIELSPLDTKPASLRTCAKCLQDNTNPRDTECRRCGWKFGKPFTPPALETCPTCGRPTTQESIKHDDAKIGRIPPEGISLKEIERRYLLQAMKMSDGVQKDAAQLLHISPRVFNYKMKTHGLKRPVADPRDERKNSEK